MIPLEWKSTPTGGNISTSCNEPRRSATPASARYAMVGVGFIGAFPLGASAGSAPSLRYNRAFTDKRAVSMLESQQLAAQRGAVTLFSGLDFRLAHGEALLVTGANGSGKTTLLRIVAGLTEAAAGSLLWRDGKVAPFAPALRSAVLYIGHAPALKDELTAEENLASLVRLHNTRVDHASVHAALAEWALDKKRALPTRVLSQGQRRRIGLARLGLVARPIWVLDEPTTALDAAGIALLQSKLSAHLLGGGLAVIATHQAFELPAGAARSLRLQ